MKFKKITYFLVSFLLLSTMLISSSINVNAATVSRVYYSLDSSSVIGGQDFNIYVNCENINDLYGASVDFKYDKSMLKILNITEGDAFNKSGKAHNVLPLPTADGIVSMATAVHGNVAGFNGSGKLFVIKAKALKTGTVNLKTTNDFLQLETNGLNMCVKLANANAEKIAGVTFQNSSFNITTTPPINPPLNKPLTVGKYEETNPAIKFSGNWTVASSSRYSGNSAKYSATSGNSIEFSFTGTGFRWFTALNTSRGIAKVTVDGVSYNVDNYSSGTAFNKVIYQKINLALGTHTVKIEVTSNKNTASKSTDILLDAVEILNSPTTLLTAGKYEETNPAIKFSGNWTVARSPLYSGSSAKYSATSGNSIEFSFTGTGFRWFTALNGSRGIAKVTVDGASYNVDNYSSSTVFNKVIYQKVNLALGTHTVKIEVTPSKNTASKSTDILLDAVEILNSPTTLLTAGKYEETNPAIKFSGNWTVARSSLYSGSSAKYSGTSGNAIEFSFTGTGFRWFTALNASRGIAKVTLDGVSYNVDNYSGNTLFNKVIYQKTYLSPGTHTVKIEVTPSKNASSKSTDILLDAIEILK